MNKDIDTDIKTISINGIEYTTKTSIESSLCNTNGLDYVIIRTLNAGVHAGYLKMKDKNEVELLNARRLWYWSGAASLSELAIHGVKHPQDCKFPCVVPKITILGVLEVIQCTTKAYNSIQAVPVWSA